MNSTAVSTFPAYESRHDIYGAVAYVSDLYLADAAHAKTLFVRFGCHAYIAAHG